MTSCVERSGPTGIDARVRDGWMGRPFTGESPGALLLQSHGLERLHGAGHDQGAQCSSEAARTMGFWMHGHGEDGAMT